MRSELQEQFEALNPAWKAEAFGVAPDGDVFLTDEQVCNFQVPACCKCGGILKPDVTFFGDTVCPEKVNFVHQRLAESDSMLVAGSSMQVSRFSSHTAFPVSVVLCLQQSLLPQFRTSTCGSKQPLQSCFVFYVYSGWDLASQLACLGFPVTLLPVYFMLLEITPFRTLSGASSIRTL